MIPRQIKKPITAWNIAELAIGSISVLTIFVGFGIWIYQGSHTPDFYCGRIVDKRVSVFESKQGSYFVNELSIEDEKGHRFKVQVLDEVYKRAVPGMLIRKSSKGLELSRINLIVDPFADSQSRLQVPPVIRPGETVPAHLAGFEII